MPTPTTPTSGLAPGFLVAAPGLRDPNFARSLVLIADHEDRLHELDAGRRSRKSDEKLIGIPFN